MRHHLISKNFSTFESCDWDFFFVIFMCDLSRVTGAVLIPFMYFFVNIILCERTLWRNCQVKIFLVYLFAIVIQTYSKYLCLLRCINSVLLYPISALRFVTFWPSSSVNNWEFWGKTKMFYFCFLQGFNCCSYCYFCTCFKCQFLVLQVPF